MKRNDIILTGAMVIIALVWFLLNKINSGFADSVSVYRNNIRVAEYSLSNDAEYTVNDDNALLMRFSVKDGIVNTIYANCPDKLCVHQKPINNNNELIVCLPNKIVLKIENSNKSEDSYIYDAVTK